jgi:hypothetical protein
LPVSFIGSPYWRPYSARSFFEAGGLSRPASSPCFVAVTLVLHDIFKPVNGRLSLFATSVNLAGITLEAFRLNPQGVDIALVCHGFYCLLIGYLIFRSTFLPPILGALMAFAGLAWMTFLLPPLANYLSPYNVASGFLGEGSPMQWLLVMGVHVERWQERGELRRGSVRKKVRL